MELSININNVTKISADAYSVEFTSNFDLSDLFYEVSTDGINWSSPIVLPQTSSPQNITVGVFKSFKVRLSSEYIAPIPPPTPYTRIHSAQFNEVFN